MGHGNWSAASWERYRREHVAGRSREDIFRARGMRPAYDPRLIGARESRDGAENPRSTPVIIGVDVTGSMGSLAEELVVRGLHRTFSALLERRPISDPHLMALAIGDACCDAAPLQATQFEADVRIVAQLSELWLEGGGGGNRGESYSLAHLFAALKTVHDAGERRGEKGFLFTVGDEPNLDGVTREQLRNVLGLDARADLSARECARLAERDYHVFHVIVDGSYAARDLAGVRRTWDPVLPGRVLHLRDPGRLAEAIVGTIEAVAGRGAAGTPPDAALLAVEDRRRTGGRRFFGWGGR